MCGIIGKISRQGVARPLSNGDLDRVQHRGPDDRGIYNDSHVSFGHLRLSIIDLSSAGHQPMHSVDGRYVIVYNGEVYNYLEVKTRLQAEGVRFQTKTDTEVVLNAFIHQGSSCLQLFRGMFAFAIWDQHKKQLFMARDRCGEKPFIYFMNDKEFLFSSEFKGLVPLLPDMPRLNPPIVDMYLHYQYAPEPHTLLEGVHKLPAAHYAVLNVDNWSLEMVEYWSLSNIKADPSVTKKDIRDELEQAVQISLRSDVPVGVALSAGIDSAGIASIASRRYGKPLQAFCVGYPGRPAYDERHEAQELAKIFGCEFYDIELATESFVEEFSDFALLLDEPVADIAAYGHYAVPKSCADHGIKVLLTGIGGDEVFWGYDWCRAAVSANQNRSYLQILSALIGPVMTFDAAYKLLFRLSRSSKVPSPLRSFCRELLACVDYNGPEDQLIFMAVSGAPEFGRRYQVGRGWYGGAMNRIDQFNAYKPTRLEAPILDRDIPIMVMDLLFKTWLTSNCLSLGDRVSMAVGVETRLPLLDVCLIEKVVAWRRCNPDHKNGQKALLRELLADFLPQKTVERRKSGFVPPVTKWLGGIAAQHGRNLSNGHLVDQGIIESGIKKHIDGKAPDVLNFHTLYRLILLELWYSGLNTLYHRK